MSNDEKTKQVVDPHQQAPRKPSNLPAGASLSERIAALQKSSSQTGRSSSASNASASPSSIALDRSFSAGGYKGGSTLGGKNPANVRERIAKFQNSDKPLIPKSSFGSPAPMHADRNQHVVRPYPGANASGQGSGSWGEGVLRPQVTGGAWTSDGRAFETGNLKPQLTGGAWLGAGQVAGASGASSLRGNSSPNGSLSRSPMRQRDAFLDLEDDPLLLGSPQKRKPLRRDSSFTEAQMAAASMGLSRSSRAASTDGTAESVGASSTLTDHQEDIESNATTLPDLPAAPTKEISGPSPSTGVSSELEHREANEKEMPPLPSPPSEGPTPRKSSLPRRDSTTDDVEIGVAGASPEKIAQLRRTLSGSYDSKDSNDLVTDPPPAPFLADIRARGEQQLDAKKPNEDCPSTDCGASDLGRLALHSTGTDDGTESGSGYNQLSPTDVGSQLQGKIESAHSATNKDLHEQHDSTRSFISQEDVKGFSEEATSPLDTPKQDLDVEKPGPLDTNTATNHPLDSLQEPVQGNPIIRTTPPPDTSTVDEYSTSEAAMQAKQAISVARTRSQRIKRPPPGGMMSVAEMDADDDDFEPGWASVTTVYSSSRRR